MDSQNAMNKYKGKVDNISFDVAKGARERYKKIAKESNMKLGEFVITAMEEYIRLHDLDTVDTYAIKPADSDELIYLEKDNCYFPISAETKSKIESGEIEGINVHENNLQISGINWSILSYSEKLKGNTDDDEENRVQVGCPVPMITKTTPGQDIKMELSPISGYDNRTHLETWYSIFKNMFLYNAETNGITYKLDHHPYRVIRNLNAQDNASLTKQAQVNPGETQRLDLISDSINNQDENLEDPLTRKDLKDTLPQLIEAAIQKYFDKN